MVANESFDVEITSKLFVLSALKFCVNQCIGATKYKQTVNLMLGIWLKKSL